MQKHKNRGSMANLLAIVCVVSYVFMHLYFTYAAFVSFKLWFTAIVFLAPVIGDLLFIGVSIAAHNWVPLIWLSISGALYCIVEAMPSKQGKTNEDTGN